MSGQQMKTEGIGRIYGGTYQSVVTEGMAFLLEDVQAQTIHTQGTLWARSCLQALETLHTEGASRFGKDVKADIMRLEGMSRAKGRVMCREFIMEGRLTLEDELQADTIRITASNRCRMACLHGDAIHLQRQQGKRLHTAFDCQEIECTTLTASYMKCKTLRAQDVTLGPGCRIGRLEYSGELKAAPDAVIRHCIRV